METMEIDTWNNIDLTQYIPESDPSRVLHLAPVLVEIFRNLPIIDRFRYRRVNTRWNLILQSDSVWKNEIDKIGVHSDYITVGRRVTGRTLNIWKTHLLPFGEDDFMVRSDKFDDALLAILRQAAPWLKSLQLYYYRDSFMPLPVLEEIIQAFQKSRISLKELTLHGFVSLTEVQISNSPFFYEIKRLIALCTPLKSLFMDLYTYDVMATSGFRLNLLEQIPALESLDIYTSFKSADEETQFLRLINQKLGPTLKRFCWRGCSADLKIPAWFFSGLQKLEELQLEGWQRLTKDGVNDFFRCCSDLLRLRRMSLIFMEPVGASLNSGLKLLFENCPKLMNINLGIRDLNAEMLLDVLSHRQRALSWGKPPLLEVHLGFPCSVSRGQLSIGQVPPGVAVDVA